MGRGSELTGSWSGSSQGGVESLVRGEGGLPIRRPMFKNPRIKDMTTASCLASEALAEKAEDMMKAKTGFYLAVRGSKRPWLTVADRRRAVVSAAQD